MGAVVVETNEMKFDLYSTFQRVVVINLPWRTDRLSNFQKQLDAVKWPFRDVEVVRAIHGDTVGVRDGWQSGGGAYGCMRSHTRVLEDALMDKVESLLVFEDDAFFLEPQTWHERTEKFMSTVPADWQCLMIGGQHIHNEYKSHSDGIVRCVNAQRTHCYALRGKEIIRELYRLWCKVDCHIDWKMGPFMAGYKTYAPTPFLVGQDQGRSDIRGSMDGRRLWSNGVGDYEAPIYLLKCDRRQADELKQQEYHRGYTLNERGEDVGLAFLADGKIADAEKVKRLRDWFKMIDDEAFALTEGKSAIWLESYSDKTLRLIQEAAGARLKVFEPQTFSAAG